MMPQQYDPEHLYDAAQKEADPIFRLHGRQAPPPMQGESFVKYDRRLTDEIKRYSPRFKDVTLDVGGSTYPIIKKQIHEDAQQEAHHPTMIPDGELREIKRIDQSGRPYSEFYGSPKSWLDMFSQPKKRLAGVNASLGNFQKV